MMHYMKKTISYKIKYKYYAVGEQNKKIENIDRRVEIYIYAKANNNDTFLDTIPDSITLSHPKCITTAYDVLAMSRKFVIKKKKVEYVVVEMEIDHYLSRKRIKDSIYYAVVSNDTNISYVRAKWRKRGSGFDWYARARYQVEIPKNSFDKFKLFYVADLPCKTCGYIIGDSTVVQPKIDTCTVYDALISHNIQYKTSLFNKKTIEARVPKEFVNPSTNYFHSYSDLYNSNSINIVWKTKSGKKNTPYYFLTLPLFKEYGTDQRYSVPLIQKREPCCIKIDSFFYCKIWCLGSSWGNSIKLGAELGAYQIQNNTIPYLGLGVYKEKEKTQYNIMIGIDIRSKLMANLRYQYNYVTLPLNILNPFANWGTATSRLVFNNAYFLRLYTGSALTLGNLEKTGSFVNHDIHLGISVASESRFINRFFVQYGYGYDYTGTLKQQFNTALNYGIIFRL